jgi:hypothetical protein
MKQISRWQYAVSSALATEMRGRKYEEHDFLVVGVLGAVGLVTAHLSERPYINKLLETGFGWEGVAPGTKLHVASITIKAESEESFRSIPRSDVRCGN